MEVLLAEEYGFCFGVERAVDMVEDALSQGGTIRSLGALIHNSQEMQRLEAKGVTTISTPDEADANTTAVIRAHGVTPQVQRELEASAAHVIDATCPFVTRVQHLAERAAKEGRDVVVAGNPDHPEMIGVVGYAPDNTYVARIDQLADTLAARFAPSEICELARNSNEVVRALAQEALAQTPTSTLIGLLADPIDSEIAREALERQATDYGSEEARRIVHLLDQADMSEDDL